MYKPEFQGPVELSTTKRSHRIYYLLHPKSKQIIYIGRSLNPKKRHQDFCCRTGVQAQMGLTQRHVSFVKACDAELTAIQKHAPEHNKRLVSARGRLGLPNSQETRSKISKALQGRVQTPEHIAKNAAAQKRPVHLHTPEMRAKAAAARTGKKRGPYKKKGKVAP